VERAALEPPTGMKLVAWRLPSYSFVVWNERRPGLSDPRVRQALAMLTDRARYREAAYRGRASDVTGPYPLGSPSYDTEVKPWPYDPARARALLDQAGIRDRDGDGKRELDGKPFTISFLASAGSKTIEPLVTLMQEDFARAGVTLEAVPTEWGALLERLRAHSFDAAALQWTMQPVQSNYQLFFSSEAERGQNYGGFKSPEADRLLTLLQSTPLGLERAALDRKLHRLIHEQQPYLFLVCPEIDSLVATRVAGFAPSQDGLGFERMALAAPAP
jgi:peptide/nickel transport system substrate-binding protein